MIYFMIWVDLGLASIALSLVRPQHLADVINRCVNNCEVKRLSIEQTNCAVAIGVIVWFISMLILGPISLMSVFWIWLYRIGKDK